MKYSYLKHTGNVLIIISLLTLSACNQNNSKQNITLLSEQTPADTALIFGSGIISTELSHESSIAFNHDMTELFLNRRKPNEKYKIYTMKFVNGEWSNAELASFYSTMDEEYSDYRPRLNPQGDILYFNSNRPLIGETKSSGLHQWYVRRNDSGWEQPIPLKDPPFSEASIVDVSSTKSGNLYFSSNIKDGQPQDEGIYSSAYQNGEYMPVQRMGKEINSTDEWTCCPYVAPDESYIIYDSPRPSGFGHVDLYISFFKNNSWTKSYNLGSKVNTEHGEGMATISPDGKYLFFYRDIDGTGDIYWADFAQLKNEILERIDDES